MVSVKGPFFHIVGSSKMRARSGGCGLANADWRTRTRGMIVCLIIICMDPLSNVARKDFEWPVLI